MKDTPWIITGAGNKPGKCLRCGTTLNVQLPQPIEVWLAAAKAFIKIHARCQEVEVPGAGPAQ